jgi:hypothetical protein
MVFREHFPNEARTPFRERFSCVSSYPYAGRQPERILQLNLVGAK